MKTSYDPTVVDVADGQADCLCPKCRTYVRLSKDRFSHALPCPACHHLFSLKMGPDVQGRCWWAVTAALLVVTATVPQGMLTAATVVVLLVFGGVSLREMMHDPYSGCR